MGLYDRDYMRDRTPEPGENRFWSIFLVVLFLAALLTGAYFRQNPRNFKKLQKRAAHFFQNK
jgi:hypothetical protein